jgi:hypothetical protein
MPRRLLLGVSAIALIAGAAASSPAQAQVVVPDASIEGPIQTVDPTPGSGTLGGNPVTWVGTMEVMGVTIRVLTGASINSPTTALTLADVGAPPALPGRSQDGFLGGTAIVTGDTAGGILYATDVFVEPAEHVIVGEATAQQIDGDIRVNGVRAQELTDARIDGADPINGFGFKIAPASIPVGTLLAIEGYYGTDGILHYHTLESDAGGLANPGVPEVSVLRAQCRIRGGGRDELEVRGGTHTPAGTAVTIEISDSTVATGPHPGQWRALTPTVTPVVDNTVSPPQGLYRFNRTNLNLPGSVCPAFVRASILNHTVHSADFAPASR